MLNPQTISWLAAAALLSACAQSTAPAVPAKVTSKQEAAAALQRQDYVTAERLYRSLAEQGDASAQHFLGKMYESGEGMRRDPVEAAKWFRLAADQGHTGAQFYLAGCTPVAAACSVTTCKRICGSISVQRVHRTSLRRQVVPQ